MTNPDRTIFTCKVCGLKTHDITRPCPHWWGLLWSWLKKENSC